jgi:hypothetical protein
MLARSSALHAVLRQIDFSDSASITRLLVEAVAGGEATDNLRRCLVCELADESAPFHRFLRRALVELSTGFHSDTMQACCVLSLAAAAGDNDLLRTTLPFYEGGEGTKIKLVRALRCAVVNGRMGAAALLTAALRHASTGPEEHTDAIFLGQLMFLAHVECAAVDGTGPSRTEGELLLSLRALLAICADDVEERGRCVQHLLLTPIPWLHGHGTVVHLAVSQSYRQVLRALISSALDGLSASSSVAGDLLIRAARLPALNFRDAHGQTPLAMAVKRRDVDAVRLLLTHGASPHRPCRQSLDDAAWAAPGDWLRRSSNKVDQRIAAALATDEPPSVPAGAPAALLRMELQLDDPIDKLQDSLCASSAAAALADLADQMLRQRHSSGLVDYPDEALRLLVAAVDVDPWSPAAGAWLGRALEALAPELAAEWRASWDLAPRRGPDTVLLQRSAAASSLRSAAAATSFSLFPPHVNVQLDGQQSVWLALPSADALAAIYGLRGTGAVQCSLMQELCGVVCSTTAPGCAAAGGDLVFFAPVLPPGPNADVELCAHRIVRRGPVSISAGSGSSSTRTVLRRVVAGAGASTSAADVGLWLNPRGSTVLQQLEKSLQHRERWRAILEQRTGHSVWARELAGSHGSGGIVKCTEIAGLSRLPSGAVLVVLRESSELVGIEM